MKSVHLVIPDLFLPKSFAAEVSAGLRLPALEKLLGRGQGEMSEAVSLEQLLCGSFDLPLQDEAPIAPISAAFDGLAAGCWMRADPVNLNLQRDRLLMSAVQAGSAEAAALSASLNEHFAGQGLEFFAPHPQRWYVRLGELPRIRTTPLSQALGGDVRGALPGGADASRWHQLFNEIQMLLHAHPLNEAREARGEPTINSVWFWGGGCDRANGSLRSSGEPVGLPLAGALLQKNYDSVSSDDVLAEMFARAAGVPFSAWASLWRAGDSPGKQLLVWTGLRSALQRGDLADWQAALQDFESGYAQPLLAALRSGKIAGLQLDIPSRDSLRSMRLARADIWAFWRRSGRLAGYSIT
ncbi:MAG: 2,3-bisphosphoglycerate-independent phosphoglycerate mutase [Candidatus Gallionella acididurans]|uniref:2,3-bisphosphoglycerate-independent phosphoglycerate mutase n=1 Tax=Candidatus Gallionella acididurans TaxID=1796491 RepID=A0A139BWD5_9PROT|nr:MAG: 2,3-bisphosphoglycerate-independent phosphoglycerate mutase [Candidatus Gallionella acididurans]